MNTQGIFICSNCHFLMGLNALSATHSSVKTLCVLVIQISRQITNLVKINGIFVRCYKLLGHGQY